LCRKWTVNVRRIGRTSADASRRNDRATSAAAITGGMQPRSDHLVIAPRGVWVVDAKRYSGKIRVEKPLLGAAKLKIAGRDRTKLVDGLAKQVAAVRDAVADIAPGTPVHGAFCFVQGDLPLLGTPQIKGFELLHRRLLAKRLNATGPLDGASVARIAAALADRFASA
jgi:Nuclease-related domain